MGNFGTTARAARLALQFIQRTLIVVTLSIFLHGTSVKPLMEHVWQRRKGAVKP